MQIVMRLFLFLIGLYRCEACFYYEYLGKRWVQTDGKGNYIYRLPNKQLYVLDCEDFYEYLRGININDALQNVNLIIEKQIGKSSTSQDISQRADKVLIETISEHIVKKGHYGYLPFKPLAPGEKRAVGRRGETLVDRLEINEARSYFLPTTQLSDLSKKYSGILSKKFSDLFSINVVSNTKNSDKEHADAYAAVYNEMLKEARNLILDIRKGIYVAKAIDFDNNTETIKLFIDSTLKERKGVQPDDTRTSYTTVNTICMYIKVISGTIQSMTAFPGSHSSTLSAGSSQKTVKLIH